MSYINDICWCYLTKETSSCQLYMTKLVTRHCLLLSIILMKHRSLSITINLKMMLNTRSTFVIEGVPRSVTTRFNFIPCIISLWPWFKWPFPAKNYLLTNKIGKLTWISLPILFSFNSKWHFPLLQQSRNVLALSFLKITNFPSDDKSPYGEAIVIIRKLLTGSHSNYCNESHAFKTTGCCSANFFRSSLRYFLLMTAS